MAKERREQEGRVLPDEKLVEATISFISRHRAKIIAIIVIVLAVVLVWVVGSYAERSREEEIAEYLEENLYKPLGITGSASPFSFQNPGTDKSIDVDEIVKKVEESEARPYVLWLLAKYLFEQGGEPNLRKAKKFCEILRDEYTDPRYELYQSFADKLLSKIEEELSWRPPKPAPFGPPAPPEGYEKASQPEEKAKAEMGEVSEASGEKEKKAAEEIKSGEEKRRSKAEEKVQPQEKPSEKPQSLEQLGQEKSEEKKRPEQKGKAQKGSAKEGKVPRKQPPSK